jgi:hypothetical protein
MNIFGEEGRDENPLYYCKTWYFDGIWKNNTFDLWKSFVSIAKICCFDVFIILHYRILFLKLVLDLNERTLLILILLYFSPKFRLEYRIKDFVFTIWWPSQGLNLEWISKCYLCLVARILVSIDRWWTLVSFFVFFSNIDHKFLFKK